MSALLSDTFNRANAGTMGSTDGAGALDPQAWVAQVGTWGINTNQARNSSGTSNGHATVDASTGDVTVQVTVPTVGADQGIIFRWSNGTNYWLFRGLAGGWSLFKIVANVSTTIFGPVGSAAANGDVIKVVCNGDNVEAFVNGVSLGSTTDAFNKTATKHGILCTSTTTRFDDFSITGAITKNVTDTVGVTDVLSRTVHLHPGVTDTVGVTDGVGRRFTLPLITINVTAPQIVLGIPTIATPTPAGQQTDIEIFITDRTGHIYGRLTDVFLHSVTWRKNQPTEAAFDVSIDDPQIALVPMPKDGVDPNREIQIRRNGHILLWGPITRRTSDSKSRVYRCTAKDPMWYLTKRNVGPANRHDFLPDGNFDNNFTYWTQVGALTKTIDTADYAKRPQSAKLVATGSGDNYIYSRFVITAGELGLSMFLKSWVKVDSLNSAAKVHRAAVILRVGATGPGSIGIANIDENTPLEKWEPLDSSVHIPPFTTEVIEFRNYAIDGTVHYGANTVTVEQSLGFGPAGNGGNPWDQVTIFHHLVQYFAGRDSRGPEKSDVGIGVAGDVSGIIKERVYQFFDHQPGYQNGTGSGCLDQFLIASDGIAFRIQYTPNTRTCVTGYPNVGTTYTDIEFTHIKIPATPALNRSHGIVGWTQDESIEDAADQIIVLGGWGGGASREEGGYSNPDALGGLTLERIDSAPNDTPIDLLDSLATKRGKTLEQTVQTPTLQIAEPRDELTGEIVYPLIGKLLPCDVISLNIVDGDVVMSGPHELAQVVYDAENELLLATPNVPALV